MQKIDEAREHCWFVGKGWHFERETQSENNHNGGGLPYGRLGGTDGKTMPGEPDPAVVVEDRHEEHLECSRGRHGPQSGLAVPLMV